MADNKHNTFTDANITRVIATMTGYDSEETLCTLYVREMDAAALTKFAELAKVLGVPVTSQYGNLTLTRRLPAAKLRENAIEKLHHFYERGEVDLEGNPVD